MNFSCWGSLSTECGHTQWTHKVGLQPAAFFIGFSLYFYFALRVAAIKILTVVLMESNNKFCVLDFTCITLMAIYIGRAGPGRASCGLFLGSDSDSDSDYSIGFGKVNATCSCDNVRKTAGSQLCLSVSLSGLKRINNCVCDMECFFRPSVKGPVVGQIDLTARQSGHAWCGLLDSLGCQCCMLLLLLLLLLMPLLVARCGVHMQTTQKLFVAHWLIMEKLQDVFLVSVSC